MAEKILDYDKNKSTNLKHLDENTFCSIMRLKK